MPLNPRSPPFHPPSHRVVDATRQSSQEEHAKEQQQLEQGQAREDARDTRSGKNIEDYRKSEEAAKGFDDDATYIPNIKK
jgi:hypothetical protein